MTKFQDDHPGGKKCPESRRQGCIKQFWKYHNAGILEEVSEAAADRLLDTKPKAVSAPAPAAAPATKPKPDGPEKAVAPAKGPEGVPDDNSEPLDPFGQQIPFADPNWYQECKITSEDIRRHDRDD